MVAHVTCIFATFGESLAVPRVTEDRKFLRKIMNAGPKLIGGSNCMKLCPGSFTDRTVISRVPGETYEETAKAVFNNLPSDVPDNRYTIIGGHRLYNILGPLCDTIVHVEFPYGDPNATGTEGSVDLKRVLAGTKLMYTKDIGAGLIAKTYIRDKRIKHDGHAKNESKKEYKLSLIQHAIVSIFVGLFDGLLRGLFGIRC